MPCRNRTDLDLVRYACFISDATHARATPIASIAGKTRLFKKQPLRHGSAIVCCEPAPDQLAHTLHHTLLRRFKVPGAADERADHRSDLRPAQLSLSNPQQLIVLNTVADRLEPH